MKLMKLSTFMAAILGLAIGLHLLPPQITPRAEALGLQDIPGMHQEAVAISASATPADEWVVFRAPFNCRLKGFSIVPAAALTGDDTDTCSLALFNRGTDGTGTTELATAIDFETDTDLAAHVETAFTLSTTDATIRLAAGDVVTLQKTIGGGGLETPGLVAVIRYEPR